MFLSKWLHRSNANTGEEWPATCFTWWDSCIQGATTIINQLLDYVIHTLTAGYISAAASKLITTQVDKSLAVVNVMKKI